MKKKISIVIPVFNNEKEFNDTIDSLGSDLTFTEIIVVDSSDSWSISTKNKKYLKNSIWTEPKGIYPALNIAIKSVTTPFIQILNSGDLLIKENFELLLKNLEKEFKFDVLVCSQLVQYKEKYFTYKPTIKDIWPHQSVIYKKKIHNNLGLYDTNWKIISDQLFFYALKKNKDKYKIVFKDVPLTIYDVTGMSSRTDKTTITEIKYLNSTLGKSNFNLYAKLFVKFLSKLFKLDFDKFWMELKRVLIYNDKP
jgi:glycosyltransferase involved in cell wall biosynthesis